MATDLQRPDSACYYDLMANPYGTFTKQPQLGTGRTPWLLVAIMATVAVAAFAIGVLDNVPDDYQRGLDSYARGDYRSAINSFTAAVTKDPKNTNAFLGRCQAYYASGSDSEAVADCTQAINLNVLTGTAYYYRGLSLYRQGKLSEATADFTSAIGRDPQFADVYYRRGRAWADQGQVNNAVSDFQRALALQPDHPRAAEMRDYMAQYQSAA
jgi:tetratricopeptide (TPR) repeat protein